MKETIRNAKILADIVNEGKKFDEDKPDYSLMPPDCLEETVKVLTYGAKKYPSGDNWKSVENAESRYFSALMRHVEEWRRGNYLDEETGLAHLAHAQCNLIFLYELSKHRIKDRED